MLLFSPVARVLEPLVIVIELLLLEVAGVKDTLIGRYPHWSSMYKVERFSADTIKAIRAETDASLSKLAFSSPNDTSYAVYELSLV